MQAMCQQQEDEAEAALKACDTVDSMFDLLAYVNHPVPTTDQVRNLTCRNLT